MIKYMIYVDSNFLEADDDYFGDIVKVDTEKDEFIKIMTKDEFSLFDKTFLDDETPSEYLNRMLNDDWMSDYFSEDDLVFDSLKGAKARREKHIKEAIERHCNHNYSLNYKRT